MPDTSPTGEPFEPAEVPRRDADLDPHFTNPADYRTEPDIKPDEWQPYRGRRAVATVVTGALAAMIAGLWLVNIDDLPYGGGSGALYEYVGVVVVTALLLAPIVPLWRWTRTQRHRHGYRGN